MHHAMLISNEDPQALLLLTMLIPAIPFRLILEVMAQSKGRIRSTVKSDSASTGAD